MNEFLLFHGAKSDIIERLSLQGLDPRFAGENAGALFGHGTYLATNSSKSDIYTVPNANGERCILVVRACLGETHWTAEPMRGRMRPPDRADGRGPLNSISAIQSGGGGCVEHPEFVVFEKGQTLPQFAIWYKHAPRCKCTHCISNWMQVTLVLGVRERNVEVNVEDNCWEAVQALFARGFDSITSISSDASSVQITRDQTFLAAGSPTRLTLHREPARMIIIRTLTGRTHSLNVSPWSKVCDIKGMIMELMHFPPSTQRLIFSGSQLEDDRTLTYYAIGDGAEVHFVPRIRGTSGLSTCIIIKPLNGTPTMYLEIALSESVANVKRRIYDEHGIPPDQQRLFHNNRLLVDADHTLESYAIENGSIVDIGVVDRLISGSPGPIRTVSQSRARRPRPAPAPMANGGFHVTVSTAAGRSVVVPALPGTRMATFKMSLSSILDLPADQIVLETEDGARRMNWPNLSLHACGIHPGSGGTLRLRVAS